MKEMFKKHMKDPEFARLMLKEDLIMAITEAICETLNSYGFEQKTAQEQPNAGDAKVKSLVRSGWVGRSVLSNPDRIDKYGGNDSITFLNGLFKTKGRKHEWDNDDWPPVKVKVTVEFDNP